MADGRRAYGPWTWPSTSRARRGPTVLAVFLSLLVACGPDAAPDPCVDVLSDACQLETVRALASEAPRQAVARALEIEDPLVRDAALLEVVRLTGLDACPDVTHPTTRDTCDDVRGRRHLWDGGPAPGPEDAEGRDPRHVAEARARAGDLDGARASCAQLTDARDRDECAFRIADAVEHASIPERLELCAASGSFRHQCREHLRRAAIHEAVLEVRGQGFLGVLDALEGVEGEVDPGRTSAGGDDDSFWTEALVQVFLSIESSSLGATRALESGLALEDPRRRVVDTARAYAWDMGTEAVAPDLDALISAYAVGVLESPLPQLGPTDPLPWGPGEHPSSAFGRRPWPLEPSMACGLSARDRRAVALLWAQMSGEPGAFVPVAVSGLADAHPVVRAYAVTAALEHVLDRGGDAAQAAQPLIEALERLERDPEPVLVSLGGRAAVALEAGTPMRDAEAGRVLCGRARPVVPGADRLLEADPR